MTGKVDCHASLISHARHLVPIWLALPPSHKGAITTTKPATLKFLKSKGVTEARLSRPRGSGPLVLIASFADAQLIRNRRRIYVEHGVGNVYPGCPKLTTNGSYSGGNGHEGTAAFLCPSQTVADRWSRYQVPRFVIGAPPYLDHWLNTELTRPLSPEPLVAVAFHWDGRRLCPELQSAWGTFLPVLPELCRKYKVLAHGHPRSFAAQVSQWERMGAEIVPDYDDILARATVLVADNSSIMYEFAALDRPVLALNDPSWRRDVEHGLRFWSHIPGIRCGNPDYLLDDLADTIGGDPYSRSMRVLAAKAAYDGLCDGRSTERAVNAVLEVVNRYAA